VQVLGQSVMQFNKLFSYSLLFGQSISVIGIMVNTASITSFGCTGITDSTIYFNNVKLEGLVDVTGTQVGTALTWDAVEIEN
jgi:hypothetical protein